MNREQIAALLPSLLPSAVEWATGVSRWVMETGEPLHPKSRADAQLMGVAYPDAVRVVFVDQIPQPERYPVLMQAAQAVQFLGPDTAGLALQSAILIRSDCKGWRRLIAHELVHVGQYERAGSIEAFLAAYLGEVVRDGYKKSPMEQEADTLSEKVPHELLS